MSLTTNDPYSALDLEHLFHTEGGRILEIPRLTREELLILADDVAILWVAAGMSCVRRRRILAASLFYLYLARCERGHCLDALAMVMQLQRFAQLRREE